MGTTPRTLLKAGLVTLGYLVAGGLGDKLLSIHPGSAVVWPPAGVAVAALVLFGIAYWPAIFAGALLHKLLHHHSLAMSLGIATANTIGPVLIATALRRFGFDPRFQRQRDVGLFATVIGIGSAVSASMGTAVQGALSTLASPDDARVVLVNWWLADTGGTVAIAAFLMTLNRSSVREIFSSNRRSETATFLAVAVVVAAFAGRADVLSQEGQLIVSFLGMTLVAWAALRLGLPLVTASALILSASAAWSHPPLQLQTGGSHALLHWTFANMVSLLGLLLYAMQSERSGLEEQRAAEALWRQTLLKNSRDGLVVVCPQGTVHEANGRFAQMLGYTEAELRRLHIWDWDTRCTPEEWARSIASADSSGSQCETRHRRADGSLLDVEVSQNAVWWRDRKFVICTSRDIGGRLRAEQLRRQQSELLELIAKGTPMRQTLDALARVIESHAPGARCAIHVVAPGRSELHLLSAPTLPVECQRALAQVPIDPTEGSCGAAAHSGLPVVNPTLNGASAAQDHRSNPSRPPGLGACRSTPFLDLRGRVLGTFGMYYTIAGDPPTDHLHLIHAATHIASICVERARDEEALRLSEHLLRRAQEIAHATPWTFDVATRLFSGSDAGGDTLGHRGQPISEATLFAQIDPEARPSVVAAWQATLAGQPYAVEHRMQTPHGVRWVDVRGQPEFDGNGRVIRVVGITLDITDRKTAELAVREYDTRTRLIVDHAIDAVISVDSNGRIAEWNREAERTFGILRQDAIGRPASRWIPDPFSDLQETDPSFASLTSRRLETVARRIDGSEFPAEVSLTPIQTHRSSLVIVFLRDISQRIRSETARRALESQLRQSQKLEAIGTLAGGIAHDFNNILGAILGHAALSRDELPLDHPTRESLGEIEKAAHRAKNLVRQILTFSRQQGASRSPVSLAPVIEDAAAMLRATLPAGVKVVRTIDPAAPQVLADTNQIHQVILNLGTNAWQALQGPTGRIEISLTTRAFNPTHGVTLGSVRAGPCAVLSVIDSGCGMTASVLERIFEPFFTTKPPGQGTGLGLAVVHGIVQSHDGAIQVRSQPGVGTTFDVLLPGAPSPAPDRLLPSPGTPAIPKGHGQHLLIVDDEEPILHVLERMLRRLGYRVMSHVEPAAALHAFLDPTMAFDLVITDLNMPTLSGLELAEEMRKSRPTVPILLNSGHLSSDDCLKATGIGICRVLSKPNTVEELGEVVSRTLAEAVPTRGTPLHASR